MRSLARWVGFSFVLFSVACGTPAPVVPDAGEGTTDDAGEIGPMDAGTPDAGQVDAGDLDAGATDAGQGDAGEPDAGEPDAGASDAGAPDAGEPDAGPPPDAGELDAGLEDAGVDAGVADAGVDAGLPLRPVALCLNKMYECGDALDNDGDGLVDSDDPDCVAACDNSEVGFPMNIPGMNNAPCQLDCYFDQDTGNGNDDCYWNQRCDPSMPNPGGGSCSYNPGTNVTPGLTCTTAITNQSAQCKTACGPLVPNGCDCFGCCALPGLVSPVFLGASGCRLDGGCPTCVQVTSCLNTCERCELCVGKTSLPADCLDGGAAPQVCPADAGACGLPGQPFCPQGQYCVTGCCQPTVN